MKKSELKQLIKETIEEISGGVRRPMDMDNLYRLLDRLGNDYTGEMYVDVNGKVIPVVGVSYKKIPTDPRDADEGDWDIVQIILKT